ncbi:putative iron-regulated membrane protein [Methylophaga frappieri]|uniref:Putative iron-regulated membrane protein n=1 Tax=Methylophaga frappieri (strain ATCC BAA-2434 / DSM 25690 / JAM7) TaxID=754477 RepID=I1YEM5_METFJ|nr:PepSY-associated TM helix domain-containing protein [Methylophaga frappieri]AFJ01368.1 putative iron-regulated membrane protein [Methylophaga frappieri]
MKVNADVIRIYKSVHTWVGIISGMALFIAFYAGSLTIFKDTLTDWATPPIESAEITPLAEMPDFIARIIAAEPEATGTLLVSLDPEVQHTHQVLWMVEDENAGDHDVSANRYYTAHLNTNDELITEEVHPAPVADFIDTLHRVVGLPVDSDPNRWIMGIFSGLYALALVSGLIILLPILVKELFAFRLGRKPKRVWLDAHNVVGVTSLPFHIIMVCTAFVFAYHDLLYGAQNEFIHDGKIREAFFADAPKPVTGQSTNPAEMVSTEKLIATAQALSPNFKPYQIEFTALTTPRASVRIWGHDDKAIAPRHPGGFVAINPYSGEVQSTEYLPGKQSGGMVAVSSFFALHFATYGGSPIRWAYFILGLAGAWLFYTGNLLWLENRRKRQKAKEPDPVQRKDVTILAILTVGVCLGSVCGISLMLATTKWLSGQSIAVFSSFQWVYYLMFFAAIGWSLLRGAARSLVDLLWLATVLTAAIPLSSLIGLIVPATGLWMHTEYNLLLVDAIALLMAGGFATLAKATMRRVYHGEARDSIWAYQPKPIEKTDTLQNPYSIK